MSENPLREKEFWEGKARRLRLMSCHDHGNCELCDQVESSLEQAQTDVEALLNALTRDGQLVPYHLECWADAIREQNGYSGANLEVWLRNVAKTLAALPEHLKEQADE